ncbi:MAG: hypothetical protein ACYTAN_04790 [Planctomycetota bacterium]
MRIRIADVAGPVFFAVFLLLCGCSTPCRVRVDAIADPAAPPHRTFVVLPGQEDVTARDLHFKEYSGIVQRALEMRDYEPAGEAEAADFAVLLRYGMSRPHTTTHVSSSPIYDKDGDIVGSDVTTDERTTYYRFVEIESVDAGAYRASGEITPFWKTTAISEGASGDMREIFPYLVAASVDYFATDTRGQVTVEVTRDNPAYTQLCTWGPSTPN